MKCSRCQNRAVINMRQHKLALCREHYLDWFVDQTERFIDKYHMFRRSDRILVAVSGGKDSLTLWDVLWRLNYQADGLYIHLGIQGEDHYSDLSQRYVEDFAQQNQMTLHVVNIQETYQESIADMAQRTHRGEERPCGVCGMVKRHVMNRLAREQGYNVLVTGHNLDDEAAVLYGNTLIWSVDLLRRQEPVLEAAPGFARKAKPLCRFYERETAAYAVLRGIDYIEEECPFSKGSKLLQNKNLLNTFEESQPGFKLRFYLSFLNARKQGLFAPEPPGEDRYAQRCPICGQPTSSDGPCAFCKIVKR